MKTAERIVAGFDFGAVEKVMQLLNWKWNTLPGGPRVPTIPELRVHALELLTHCASDPSHSYIATGGFVARRERGELGNEYLSLTFEAAHSIHTLES